jgi:uncharacterized protein with ParB-like and HNH nuclease domain
MKPTIGLNKIGEKTLGTIFEEGTTYAIPFWQREYSWEKDDWTNFCEDLDEAVKNDKGHFFGFMAMKEGKEYDYEIIEGQQRITTVLIFFSVIRDLSNELGLKEFSEDLQTSFITAGNKYKYEMHPKSRLTLSRINKDFFKKYIEKSSTLKEKESLFKKEFKKNDEADQSNRLIFNCFKHFHKKISKDIEGFSQEEKQKKLKNLVGIILHNFICAVAEVQDDIAAYNIFLTINDRGLDLALADLLKIHLCNIVSKDKEFINDFWYQVRNQLTAGNINNFLRHYWLSKYEVVKETQLLEEMRKKINNEEKAYEFIQELIDEVDTYESLLTPTKENWGGIDPDLHSLLSNLQTISATIPLPLLMAAAAKLKPKELKNVIFYCTTFIFRYLTIGEQESKVLEKLFSDLAIDIRNNKITKAEQVKTRLSKHNLSDELFEVLLMSKDIKLNKVARYILEMIENYLDPNPEKIMSDKITLEHILPKNPDGQWDKYIKDNNLDHANLVYKLGNLTLLIGKVNNKLRNKFLDKKVEEFKNSSKLKINQDLDKITEWKEKDILNRQKKLTKYCLEIWSL